MKKFNVGIIGYGWAAGAHIDAINNTGLGKVTSIYSSRLLDSDEVSATHGGRIKTYTNLKAMLKDPAIDIIDVTSYPYQHTDQVIAAAKAGKHVLVEKPLSLNMAEGVEVLRVCRDRGVKVGVGLHLRHHPGHIETRRLVAEGALGTVALAQSQIGQGERGNVHSVPRAGLRDWWTHPELVGGAFAMLTIGVHAIDDLQFLLGQQVVELTAITDGQTPERPLEDLATMCLRFDGGTIGTMCCGMRLPEFQNDVALYGSEGKVMLADGSWPRLQGELRVSSETVNTNVAYEPDYVYLVARNIEDFQRAIAEDRDPAASGKHGLKLVQLTEAMAESAKTGRTIKLEPLG